MNIVNKMNVEFLSVAENVGLSRVVVAAFASQLDFTLEDLDDIKVAVSEAVSNCIIHGYLNKPDLMVSIKGIIYDNKTLEIEIKDNGTGIEDIEKAMQPAYSTSTDRMGLGFSFMQSLMDLVEVDSLPGQGTTVKLVKRLNNLEEKSREN